MSTIRAEIRRNKKSPAVAHHIKKYGNKFPIWVSIEFFSMGLLSKFYKAMDSRDKKQIACIGYQEKSTVLESWFQCLTVLRNRCAHHGRLYNWTFTTVPLTPKKSKYHFDNSLFAQLMVIKSLYHNTKLWNSTKLKRLAKICEKHKASVDFEKLGFPVDWQEVLKK